MEENRQLHNVEVKIKEALEVLAREADSGEDGRIKAIITTKLQEALLFAERIYTGI